MLRPTTLLPVALLVALAGTASAQAPLFENATAAAGLSGQRGVRVSFADLDADGAPDAIVDRTAVYLNVPAPGAGVRGRKLWRILNPGFPARTTDRKPDFVQVADVDGDGRADLFLGRSTDRSAAGFRDDGLRSEVWLGDGRGGFRKRAGSNVGGYAETTSSACFVDADRDGLLDLFVGNGYVAYGRTYEAFPDRLYKGFGTGTFAETTVRAGILGVAPVGLAQSRRPTYGVTHADWNNDGWPDLLVMTYGRQANRLWKNNGNGTFTDVGPATTFDGDADRSGKYPPAAGRSDEPAWRAHGNTFDGAVADFDGDGDLDCFLAEITHWWAGSSSDLSSLLVNLGPMAGYRFWRRPELIARPRLATTWNQGDMHAGWLDADNDGRLDLLIASSDYPDDQLLRLYHQKATGGFEDWTARLGFRWLNATQISLGDFDRDGATDILVGTNNSRLTPAQVAGHDLNVGLFRNLAAAQAGNRFLSLRLKGSGAGGANADAIGARVTITIAGKRQTREVQGGLGHAGHRDDLECRFGVGKASVIDRVEVKWPDARGSVQVFTGVATNRLYALQQGGVLKVAN